MTLSMFFRAVSGDGGEQSGVGPVEQLPWLPGSPLLAVTWDRGPWREGGRETGEICCCFLSPVSIERFFFIMDTSSCVKNMSDQTEVAATPSFSSAPHGLLHRSLQQRQERKEGSASRATCRPPDNRGAAFARQRGGESAVSQSTSGLGAEPSVVRNFPRRVVT